jgi:muramoyltetrapeptide carboxypeptidase
MTQPLKPRALRPGDAIQVVSLASPVQKDKLERGCGELARLGFAPRFDPASALAHESFFAGSATDRLAALKSALCESDTQAIFCSRGGYGSNYLIDAFPAVLPAPKILLGASDITSLQVFLWQKFRWVTFYGPMVATNFDRGKGAEHGYDRASLMSAVTETKRGWSIDLKGESLAPGEAEGVLLGGCLTLIESTLGTPWEIDARGAILVLEDRAMKPYQVDRALMHLKQAGKFREVAGIVLGDFPECEGPAGGETVRDVASRLLMPMSQKPGGMPIIWGTPVGHTSRPALTLPLGIRARLRAGETKSASSSLEILEPACTV